MSDGYRVNTDELEAVVKRLRTLQQNISQTGNKSKYNCVVTPKDLGGDFAEATGLHSAHDQMYQFLTEMISELDNLINEFGDKTQHVTNAYKEREYQGQAAMDGHARAMEA